MVRLAALFCLLIAACHGSPRNTPRILGGDDADIRDYPFAASIEWLHYGHYCGAVVVSAEWALTDAWCTTEPAEITGFKIRVGSAIAGNGTLHGVTEWIFHPLADVGSNNYDFALVKVDPPFEFSDTVAAAALPDLDQETPDGAVGAVAGWGQDDESTSDYISQLQYATISLASDANCASILGEDYNERTLCAQGANGDVALCWRDEGGPLVANGTLFGISLWPGLCADPLTVQIFGRVASVRDWIDSTIGAQ